MLMTIREAVGEAAAVRRRIPDLAAGNGEVVEDAWLMDKAFDPIEERPPRAPRITTDELPHMKALLWAVCAKARNAVWSDL